MRRKTIGRRWALVLAVVAVMLMSAQGAAAQDQKPPPGDQPPATGQPPPAGPPAPPAPQQSADLSLTLDRDSSSADEGERFLYEAHLVNNGPGTARDVAIVVGTPEEFDLDDTNTPNECMTNPGEEGRMVCRYGDLAPGAELTLKFRGQFRDNGNARTHVSASSTTPDPNPDNNRPGGERTNVQENENDGPAKPGQQSDGVAGGPPSCASPLSFQSSDVPVDIPDDGDVESTLEVDEPGLILDLDVRIDELRHPYDSDLEIEIRGPDGTTVTLVDNRGGRRDDFIDTVFDDEASDPISAGSAPFSGNYQPEEALSAFDGKLQQGTYTLRIFDQEEEDVGTLEAWGIDIDCEPLTP